MKTLLTAKDIENRLRLSRNTVYKLLQTGQLKSIKVNDDYRITEEALEEYLSRLAGADK